MESLEVNSPTTTDAYPTNTLFSSFFLLTLSNILHPIVIIVFIGYNFQSAWTGGWTAGNSAGNSLLLSSAK